MAEIDRNRQFAQAQRMLRNIPKTEANASPTNLATTRSVEGASSLSEHEELWGRCFLKGTKIQTVRGERKVENLAVGDLLPTVFGGPRPIQWIARYQHLENAPSKPDARDLSPVRIARSALALEAPHANLFLTQAHALYLEGVLVPVGRLINGTTITLYPADEFHELEFFHIKLETHDVILAEGALCETLLNVDEHAANFASYVHHYGMPKAEEHPCVPFLSFGAKCSELRPRFRGANPWLDQQSQIDVIRDRLEKRAISHGLRLDAFS
jgi:hypothetical protein